MENFPHTNPFNPLAPFVISRCFDDPNIASILLSKELEIFNLNKDNKEYSEEYGTEVPVIGRLGRKIFIEIQIWFIQFLKNYYTEKQLARAFLDQDEKTWYMWTPWFF